MRSTVAEPGSQHTQYLCDGDERQIRLSVFRPSVFRLCTLPSIYCEPPARWFVPVVHRTLYSNRQFCSAYFGAGARFDRRRWKVRPENPFSSDLFDCEIEINRKCSWFIYAQAVGIEKYLCRNLLTQTKHSQRKIPYTFFSVFCQLSTATDQSKGQLTNVTNALLNACMNIEWIRHKGSMQPFRPIHSVRTNRSRTDSDVDFRTTRSIRCSRYRWRRIHWICTKTQIYFSYLAIRRHNFDRNIGRLIVIDFCCRWNALLLVPSMHHQTVWFDESLWRTEKYWVSMKTNRFFFLKLIRLCLLWGKFHIGTDDRLCAFVGVFSAMTSVETTWDSVHICMAFHRYDYARDFCKLENEKRNQYSKFTEQMQRI